MERTAYSVAKAAELTEEKPSALRYWEEQFGLNIKRNSRGSRCYEEKDIRIFFCIRELKKKGLPLREIGEVIPLLRREIAEAEKREREQRFYQLLERLVGELRRKNRQEERYRRVDEAIRQHQIARKQVAVTEEQKKNEKKKRRAI